MKVTDIKIRLKDEKKVKAIVEVTLDNQLIIHGIRLVQTDKAFVITMPHFKGKGDKYLDLVHPANADFRKYLTDEIVTKYQELVNKK
ncbi:SpoVG family protein [uncultured Fusobacterium sp.]|uniref:SpoVG family protein n=1 Tax=uncultured Fusobacterium sp. TaxID=159267 RepID=UPI0025EC447A|nr:SpoVG family protein [uncultured Fusobacterium sp.]